MDLDPLNFPLENGPGLAAQNGKGDGANAEQKGNDNKREYSYEPLPDPD